MSKTLLLTPAWDLALDNLGDIAIKSDKQQIAQDVASACRMWKGEDVLDTSRGVPYKNEILGEKVNISLLQSHMSREGQRIDGVADIQVTVSSFENRVLDTDILITTEDGEILNV